MNSSCPLCSFLLPEVYNLWVLEFPKFTNTFLFFPWALTITIWRFKKKKSNTLSLSLRQFDIYLLWYCFFSQICHLLTLSINKINLGNWPGFIYQPGPNFVANSIICTRFPQNCSILKLHNLHRIVAIVRTTNWTWSLLHEDP
jgi:hypothetical protein